MVGLQRMRLKKHGCLCLCRILSALKVQWITENHRTPEQPQSYSQAAEYSENDEVSLNLYPLLMPNPSDEHNEDKQGREQDPAIVTRECRKTGASSCKDQISGMVILRPCQKVVAGHRHCCNAHQLAQWRRLQVQDVGIQDKNENANKTSKTFLRQPPSCKIEIDRSDEIAGHRREASCKSCPPEIVIPNERQHQELRQSEPITANFR